MAIILAGRYASRARCAEAVEMDRRSHQVPGGGTGSEVRDGSSAGYQVACYASAPTNTLVQYKIKCTAL